MKFKPIQILALLRVISLCRLENILGQSIGIQFISGNKWNSEHPEHKLVQHHKTCSIYRPEREVQSKRKKKNNNKKKVAGSGRYKKQVNSALLRNQIPLENNDFFGGLPDQ